MNETKNKNGSKDLLFVVVVGIAVALVMGLLLRPAVKAHAAAAPATSTDASISPGVPLSTSTDVDRHPYMTNDSLPLQTNDYLLSIRNILVCIWGTILFIWSYDRMKAIICRLGGTKKDG